MRRRRRERVVFPVEERPEMPTMNVAGVGDIVTRIRGGDCGVGGCRAEDFGVKVAG
jgi:hypothetical protein